MYNHSLRSLPWSSTMQCRRCGTTLRQRVCRGKVQSARRLQGKHGTGHLLSPERFSLVYVIRFQFSSLFSDRFSRKALRLRSLLLGTFQIAMLTGRRRGFISPKHRPTTGLATSTPTFGLASRRFYCMDRAISRCSLPTRVRIVMRHSTRHYRGKSLSQLLAVCPSSNPRRACGQTTETFLHSKVGIRRML